MCQETQEQVGACLTALHLLCKSPHHKSILSLLCVCVLNFVAKSFRNLCICSGCHLGRCRSLKGAARGQTTALRSVALRMWTESLLLWSPPQAA